MALGNENQTNGKLYILKLKAKDKAAKQVPSFFEVSEKVEGKWTATSEVKRVAGNLTRITIEKGEWEGSEYDIVKLILTDPEKDESYLLDLRMNLLARSLYNSLLSLTSFEDLSISLYQTKKDDKTYDAISLRQGDSLVKWKHDLQNQPRVETVKIGGKKIVDSSKLDVFYIEQLTELAGIVKSAPRSAKKPTTASTDQISQEEIAQAPTQEISDEDVF
ncbi:MAG: hypothetical protein WC390_06540 [Sulfurimonas sp.]|jgi:hypothetical protein